MGKVFYKTNQGVKTLHFKAFDDTGLVDHCFTTRIGGVSLPPFNTLNLGLYKGDNKERVAENYRRLEMATGIETRAMVSSHQVHGVNVYKATEADRGKGIAVFPTDINEVDGLVTNISKLPLITFYADCVPLFFLDVKNKAVGVSHSGWKGTYEGIGERTVFKMKEEFGSSAKDLIAAIGPSIGPCCYEVSDDLAERFIEKFWNYKDIAIKNLKTQRQHINLWSINRQILEGSGIPASNITVAEICTMCHKDIYFSFRGDNKTTGSLAAIIQLK